jgi:hypothetical protein
MMEDDNEIYLITNNKALHPFSTDNNKLIYKLTQKSSLDT